MNKLTRAMAAAGDIEMQRALEADGEKLRQMTGQDHGPFVAGLPPFGHDDFNDDITADLGAELDKSLAERPYSNPDAEQQDRMAIDQSHPDIPRRRPRTGASLASMGIQPNLPVTQPEPQAPEKDPPAPDIKTLVKRQRAKMQRDLDNLTKAKAALEQRIAVADARLTEAINAAQVEHAREFADVSADLAQIAACRRAIDLAVAELNKAEPK